MVVKGVGRAWELRELAVFPKRVGANLHETRLAPTEFGMTFTRCERA